MKIGQDEAIYKGNAESKNIWIIEEIRGVRKKSEGQGEMVSAFQCEERPFGLKISEEERTGIVNPHLESLGLTPLEPDSSPGLLFFKYGQHREGYWDYAKFERQVSDVLDVMEALHPDRQFMIEVDWSAGHAKGKEGGLNVNSMNLKYGGKQSFIRPGVGSAIEVAEGFLGNEPLWAYNENKEKVNVEASRKLKVGDVQSFVFGENDPHFIFLVVQKRIERR